MGSQDREQDLDLRKPASRRLETQTESWDHAAMAVLLSLYGETRTWYALC